MTTKITDAEFRELWNTVQSPSLMQKITGYSLAYIQERKSRLRLKTTNSQRNIVYGMQHAIEAYPGRIFLDIEDGCVIIFSDAHYWPELVSTAHRAMLLFMNQLKPQAVICNGDAFDGGAISRWPRIGWDNKPTVVDELKTVTARLGEIEGSVPKGCQLIWNLGNHDGRFETFLASRVPEFQGVKGFTLKEHFPMWKPAWATYINPNSYTPTCVTHRYRGGIHATHNNTINAGINYVTGHLHSLKVTPFTDLRGTRFGVDTGTLADPNGPQFMDYTEDSPKNQRSGFVVLTFYKGTLLWPEIVHVIAEDWVEFRGTVYNV